MTPLLLLACAHAPDADGEHYLSPDQRGAYAVGTYEDEFPGSTGLDLTVQVWFPSEDAGGDVYKYDDFLPGTAVTDAAPSCDVTHPVMVFSHGSGGIRYQSIFLTEYLASRGWIVVAPDHPYSTTFDEDDSRLGEVALRRPIDVADTFDWLAGVAAGPGGPHDGCVDPDAGYAVSGHSFGGYTTLAVAGAELDADASAAYCASHDEWLCSQFAAAAAADGETVIDRGDPRVWAAVAMAPCGYEALLGGLADITAPTMLLGGELDDECPMDTQVTPLYDGLVETPRMLGELQGAGHLTFSDGCAMLPTFDDCSPPYLDPDVAHPILATATTAFLDLALGEDAAAAWLPDPDETRWTWTEQR
jgi:predicted dienelactone hydrolase